MNSSSLNISRKTVSAVLVKLKTFRFIDYLCESGLETEYSSFRSYSGWFPHIMNEGIPSVVKRRANWHYTLQVMVVTFAHRGNIIYRGTVNSSQSGTPPTTPTGHTTPPKDADAPGQLTKEEWSKINQLLSYQPGEDILNASKHEAPNMMQMSLDVNIRQGSARVLDSDNMEILCGTSENLQVGIQVYPKTLACDGNSSFMASLH